MLFYHTDYVISYIRYTRNGKKNFSHSFYPYVNGFCLKPPFEITVEPYVSGFENAVNIKNKSILIQMHTKRWKIH